MDAGLADFSHIYWLGGSPCSGKTSAAKALASRCGLDYYSCDDAFYHHARRITPERQPVFQRVMQYGCAELWLRPVEALLADELAVYEEEFPFILEDLAGLGRQRPVIAEGAALLPWLIAPRIASPSRAMYMVPTPAFQWQHYSRREWTAEVLKDCPDPELAFQHWMERDIGFAVRVALRAGELGLPVLQVDGSRTLEENTAAVQAHFHLA